MNNEPQEELGRAILIGSVIEKKENMVKVETTVNGESKQLFILNDCVAHTLEHNNQSVFLLQDAFVNNINIRVAERYNGFDANNDALLQDIADMWVEFGEVEQSTNESQAESTDDIVFGSEEPTDNTVQFGVEEEDNTIQFGSEEEFVDDDFDDSTPAFEGHSIDLSQVESNDEKVAKKKLSAAQKVAKAREERYAEAEEVKKNLNSDISKAFVDGKRHGDLGAWNFRTKAYEMVMRAVDPITGQTTYQDIVDGKGDARVRVIVNPTITDEEHPLGMILNRAAGPNFETVEHPDVFMPVINCIDTINDSAGEEIITWDAFSFNNGGRAMLNLDVSGFAKKMRKESAKSLSNFGYINLSANRISDALVEEQGGHRLGISIINAHDGKSALQCLMTAMRTYCGNLAIRGGVQSLLMTGSKSKIRHMSGAVAEFDPEAFADRITKALHDSYKYLVASHILRHLPIEMNFFDKTLTAFDRHGLITPPSVKIAVGDTDQFVKDDKGNIVIAKGDLHKQAVKIAGGHAFNAVMSGWMNPDLDYVAMGENGSELDRQSQGTMFHAMQSLTGTITHNPIWSDGKRVLHGSTQGIETMMKRSTKATDLFETIAFQAINTYANHTGQPVDDLDAMSEWFAQNPDQIKVPYSKTKNGKTQLISLAEVPEYESTWKVKVEATL